MIDRKASPSADTSSGSKRVFVLGSTGTIGRATVHALARHGHEVVCFSRPRTRPDAAYPLTGERGVIEGVVHRFGDVTDPSSLKRDGFRGEHFDALLSCMASRTGAPADAWAIDHRAHVDALEAAQQCGVSQMVLLSAICVQKPLLAFQHAKLAFEQTLISSGLAFTVVRSTAYFKSLSGQIDRLKRGKPYLVFGDGTLTACKPISADDLGTYLADCLNDKSCLNKILPIGGPGPAITPKEQGEHLFALLGRTPHFRQVPAALLGTVARTLGKLGHAVPALAEKAEMARIGHYYATESMLVLDPKTGCYDASATPSFGSETLFDYYVRLVKGEILDERGAHAVY